MKNVKPILNMEFPNYFEFEGTNYCNKEPDSYYVLRDGKEFPITKESDTLMEALIAGKVISKGKYEKDKETHKKEMDKMSQRFVDCLNEATLESCEKNDRWERIFAAERNKWPHDMGQKSRNDIPKKFHPILDECIEISQKIARDACQTNKLTEAYFKANTKK